MNWKIPDEYKYVVEGKKKTEIYNKIQIMETIPFYDKIEIIFKEVFTKSFKEAFPLKYQHIINLKELRDDIVHLKPDNKTNTPFAFLYKRGLKFKFEDTLDAVMDFFNFHQPDYVTYCSCPNNF
jgi:hypothetical protein